MDGQTDEHMTSAYRPKTANIINTKMASVSLLCKSVKATALKQQISKFYRQILSTDARAFTFMTG